MLYPDGQKVMLGDEVELLPNPNATLYPNFDCRGRVVCLLEEDAFASGYEDWKDTCQTGIMFKSEGGGFVRFETIKPTFRLLRRQQDALTPSPPGSPAPPGFE